MSDHPPSAAMPYARKIWLDILQRAKHERRFPTVVVVSPSAARKLRQDFGTPDDAGHTIYRFSTPWGMIDLHPIQEYAIVAYRPTTVYRSEP